MIFWYALNSLMHLFAYNKNTSNCILGILATRPNVLIHSVLTETMGSIFPQSWVDITQPRYWNESPSIILLPFLPPSVFIWNLNECSFGHTEKYYIQTNKARSLEFKNNISMSINLLVCGNDCMRKWGGWVWTKRLKNDYTILFQC